MRWLFFLLTFIGLTIPVFTQSSEITNTPNITPIQSLQAVNEALDTVAFSPDGTQIATGGRDNAVRLWDMETGENTAIFAGHSDWLSTLAYSPDGTVIASGGHDNNIWLWNVQTGTSLRLIEDHQSQVRAITFTTDGQYMISGSLDGMIRIEAVGNPNVTQYMDNFGGGVWSLAISPDGTTLAVGSNDSHVWLIGLWDTNGAWLAQLAGHDTPVTALSWSDDGTQLLSGEQNGHIRLWNVTNAKQAIDDVPSTLLEGHLAPITSINFTDHESIAISTALDGTIRLWDIAGEINLGDELSRIYNTGVPLTNLAYNPNDGTTATVRTDGTLNIWSLNFDILEAVLDSQRPAVITNPPPDTNSTAIAPIVDNPIQPIIEESTAIAESSTVPLPANSAPTLMIPSVGMQVGITTFPLDGISWAIDPWESLVGHLQGTSWVNGNGNMALGGHSLYPDGRAGTFNTLYNVSLGDEIIVQDGDVVRRYVVNDIRVVPYTDISVVYPTAHSRVTLITCDIPSFHAESGLYGERLVVIADAIN